MHRNLLLGTIVFFSTAFLVHADVESDFQARKEILLNTVREKLIGTGIWDPSTDIPKNLSVNDIGKHWWPRIFAELEKDPSGESIIVQKQDGNVPIPVKQVIRGLCNHAPDYRPKEKLLNPAIGYLYFSPVGIGLVLNRHPNIVTEEDKLMVFEKTLNFEPTLSALNMFTGEGTENHMLMGRSSGYLITQAIIARGEKDKASGKYYAKAVERNKQMKEYLISTAKTTYERGTGEWDSSTYYPYVIACWLGVYEYAKDEEVKDAAKATLDWFASTLALRHTQGIFSGAEQRSGSATESGKSNNDKISWLWWGGLPGNSTPKWDGQDFGQLVYACLSSYRPPAPTQSLALKQIPSTHWNQQHMEAKPSYIIHGANSRAAESKVLYYINKSFTAGACVARPTGGWTGGDAADCLWKIVASTKAGNSAWAITAPRGRIPWRQVGQWKNVIIDVQHLPTNAKELRDEAYTIITGAAEDPKSIVEGSWRAKYAVDKKKRFPHDTSAQGAEGKISLQKVPIENVVASFSYTPEGVNYVAPSAEKKNITFIQFDDTYLAVHSLNQDAAETATEKKNTVIKDAVPAGGFGGLLIEIGCQQDHGTFADFQKQILDIKNSYVKDAKTGTITYRNLYGDNIKFEYQTDGSYIEPEFDWGYGPTQEGGFVIMSMPPFEIPKFPSGKGHGRVPKLTVNDQALDLAGAWDVYSGPNLSQSKSVLKINDGVKGYQVDYSGARPVFSDFEVEKAK